MNKKAILVVSFGTSVPQARESISAVEEALTAAVPERVFKRAYTSPTIRGLLSQRGEETDSLEQALEKMAAAGYQDIVVQPTHLLYGIEYDKMKAVIERYQGSFQRLVFGKPLLAGAADLRTLAECVWHACRPAEGALVLLGHGTAHFSNMVYPALQTTLRLQGIRDAFVGTVEGWPGFYEVLQQLQEGGYRQVTLAPFMLVAGDHACNDMAGEDPESWKSRLETAGFKVSCRMQGLGILPEVQALYVKHLREMVPLESV